MGQRRFRTGSLGSQFNAPPVVPEAQGPTVTSRRDEAKEEQRDSSYNVQDIQSTGQAPSTQQTAYNVQDIQTLAPTQQTQQVYDVQAVQSLVAQTQANATPAEQSGGQGGQPENIQPYEDLQSWFNPASAGGFGTPTELTYSAGPGMSNYGASAIQWSETANNLALMQAGISPAAMAENSINAVYAFLTDFGVRPGFITPYVQARLNLTPQDMIDMGYAQDPYGRWIALDYGEDYSEVGADSGYTYLDIGGGGGGRGGSGGSSFRSGYTSGLINWRIGL